MRNQLIVIIIVAIGLSAFLYTRPKVVVKDEQGATRDQPSKVTTEKEEEPKQEAHIPLSEAQAAKLQQLKQQLTATQTAEQKATALGEVGQLFLENNAADSAGYYFEQMALQQPTEANWVQAGDAYFQAYNLALRSENVAAFAEKTQNAYAKVLAKNAKNLHAKTNLAMTYVASASPMQAIAMLRQVIEENPNYEPALINMGVLSLQSNQYDKAVNRFRQVLRVNPQNYNAKLGLAYGLLELKETAEAKKLLQELQAEDIDENLKREVNTTLQNIK